MSRTTPRPLVPALIILFLFVAVVSPAPAIGASWSDGGTVASLFARLWGSLAAFWGEAGCGIDGNGGCRDTHAVPPNPTGRQVTANAGCIFDPNGRCQSGGAVEREAGCGFDPNGRCQP